MTLSMIYTKIKKGQKIRGDEVFYEIGKVIWLPFCMIGFWFAQTGYEKYGELAECAIRKRCGIPCPGCGGTRAFYYLFQGDFQQSFLLNPIVIFGVLCYLWYMLLYFYRKHISRTEKELHPQYYVYAAIVVILVQWGVKIIKIFKGY